MTFREPEVRRDGHRLYVRDYDGDNGAIVLMHGFPDNLHLYDSLIPHLVPTRRVVTFDFLVPRTNHPPTGRPLDRKWATWRRSSINSDLKASSSLFTMPPVRLGSTGHFNLIPYPEDEVGFLTADAIEQRSGGLGGKDIMICGPPPMIDALRTQL